MAKVMKCGDIVPGCTFVARGETEEQVLTRTAEHAKEDHGMDSIPTEVLAKVKAAIHDE